MQRHFDKDRSVEFSEAYNLFELDKKRPRRFGRGPYFLARSNIVRNNDYIFVAALSTGFAVVSTGFAFVSTGVAGVVFSILLVESVLVSSFLPELLQATTATAIAAIAKNF